MKRFMIAGLLALGVAALAQQQASAWCKFNFSGGFNICYESSGSHCTFNYCRASNPAPCCYDGGSDGHPAPYDALGAYGPPPAGGPGHPAAPYGAPPVGPHPAPQAPAVPPQAGYGYNSGYGLAQAPGYWYGN